MPTLLNLVCDVCKCTFQRELRCHYKSKNAKYFLCSKACATKKKITRVEVVCTQCNKLFTKVKSQIKKNSFCSHSCSAIYSNKHKKSGFRRSKLEIAIEQKILSEFSNLKCLFNDRSIGTELDFYFPELNLGIEFNGIIHYEPIYGENKFERIQNKDKQKILICAELGIELIVIPTIYYRFNETTIGVYWNEIKNIILARITAISNTSVINV